MNTFQYLRSQNVSVEHLASFLDMSVIEILDMEVDELEYVILQLKDAYSELARLMVAEHVY